MGRAEHRSFPERETHCRSGGLRLVNPQAARGRRPRVAIVTHELTGGVGTMTRFLYRVLSESGRYEPGVISLATSARDTAGTMVRKPWTWLAAPRVIRGEDRGMPYAHIGARFTEIEYQRYRPRDVLDRELAAYDIIQFVAGAAPWVEAAAAIPKPKCLWVATTIVGDRTGRTGTPLTLRKIWSAIMTRYACRYEERALKRADAILALSPYTVRSLAPLVDKEVTLAPCGVDTSMFRPAGNKNADRYILCVARLFDPRKNVSMLLRAYSSLAQRNPHIPDLVLVGEPLSPEGTALLTKLGIADRVRLVGPTHGDALAETYRGAMMFVLPSDEEGLGIVILEAMATGLPVVSTACGGPETAVIEGVTGYLTPVRDQAAMERAMEKLIGDAALRDSLGRAGRRVAEEKFSIEATGQVFLDQYSAFIGSP
ncbi:MAG TPA: glycosyltransferase family 4 protein [Gemmatimonadaceae bacterium]